MRPLRYKDLTAYGQALYIIGALVIFSYILFDVLDVDGSGFAKFFNPSHKTLIGVFIPAKRSSILPLSAILCRSVLCMRLSHWLLNLRYRGLQSCHRAL